MIATIKKQVLDASLKHLVISCSKTSETKYILLWLNGFGTKSQHSSI